MTGVSLMFKRKSARPGFAEGCFRGGHDESRAVAFFGPRNDSTVFGGRLLRKKDE
jgi:hypothetical protein